ncbi:MAG: hypothetical protein ACKOED_14955 [Aestuariivirga sp.]|uniref:hypothetical protein n=1 Tax=Aestuariivirga sp. TaxID=2650926 RepID=UPI0038D08DFE
MRYILFVIGLFSVWLAGGNAFADTVRFKRIPTQFIAALAEPGASSGKGAEHWGVWEVDPGPRGVWLRNFGQLLSAGGVAPSNWTFDPNDWWLDENGLIMEQPRFPLAPGQYLVTGRRAATAILTVHPADARGVQSWELGNRATIYDVTHLKCRSARYTPAAGGSCSPDMADQKSFPVPPGGVMPPVAGCNKQDYAVLFIIGVAWNSEGQAD